MKYFELEIFQALLLEKGCYPVQLVEMMDCVLEPSALFRFARSFRLCTSLTNIVLDYNE